MPFLTEQKERDLIAQMKSGENRNEALDRLIVACRHDLEWAEAKWLIMLKGAYSQPDTWLESIFARGVSQACKTFDLYSGNRFSGYAGRVISNMVKRELSLFGNDGGFVSNTCSYQPRRSEMFYCPDEYTCGNVCGCLELKELLKMRPCINRHIYRRTNDDTIYRELYSSTPRRFKQSPHQERVLNNSHYHPESPIDKIFCDDGADESTIVQNFHESFDRTTADKTGENAHYTSRLEYRILSMEGRRHPIEDALMPEAEQLPEDATEIDTSCLPAPMADIFSDLVEGFDDTGVFNFQVVADCYNLSIREVKEIYLDCVSRLKHHD